MAHKVITNASPFSQEAVIPIELELQSLHVVAQLKRPMEQSMKDRMMTMNEMDKVCLLAFQTREAVQMHCMRPFWWYKYLTMVQCNWKT